MAILDRLTRKDREWHDHAQRCGETIMRAAGVQARQHGLSDVLSPAGRLIELYGLRDNPRDWREFGAVAFHLVATWPPDLAYMILYAMREIKPPLAYDPVPLVMKAMEMLRHLRSENVTLHLEMGGQAQELAGDPDIRARACACVIARELSGVPLRWASGIYSALELELKPFVQEELKRFNPRAADILLKGNYSWVRTGTGLHRLLQRVWRIILRVLFGKP